MLSNSMPKNHKQTIAVIGAGPAGIAAALQAARSSHAVRLFESNARVGKKLLVTGSGRCNITNMNASPSAYTCSNPSLLNAIFDKLPPGQLRAHLDNFGVLTYSTADGWCYPLSESAQSVVSLLQAALEHARVDVQLNTRIKDVSAHSGGFRLTADSGAAFSVDQVIVCAGGKAQPALGASGEMFPVLKRLGHAVLPLLPALAPVLADMRPYHSLRGARLDVIARLWHETQMLAETRGNMIFTEWGMNGPAVMDLSHHVARAGGIPLRLEIDLLNGHSDDLTRLLLIKENQNKDCQTLLGAFMPPRPIRAIMDFSDLGDKILAGELSRGQRQRLLQAARCMPFNVKGVRGFEFCQMKTGGVPLSEVDPSTCQSLIHEGLYLAGETLDVLGPCGGYNLHFAFASGWLAGESAGKK